MARLQQPAYTYETFFISNQLERIHVRFSTRREAVLMRLVTELEGYGMNNDMTDPLIQHLVVTKVRQINRHGWVQRGGSTYRHVHDTCYQCLHILKDDPKLEELVGEYIRNYHTVSQMFYACTDDEGNLRE